MRSAEQAKHEDVVQLSLSALSHLAVPCPCCRQLMTLQPFYRKTCKISTFFLKSRLPQEVCPPVSCTSPACFQSMALSQGVKNKGSCPAGGWGGRGAARGAPQESPQPSVLRAAVGWMCLGRLAAPLASRSCGSAGALLANALQC